MNKPLLATENPSSVIILAEKLIHQNFTKWTKMMYIAIGDTGRLNNLTDDPLPSTKSEYQKWAQRDLMVISWIIENIHPDLVTYFLDYSTTKGLWNGITNLLRRRQDELQIFDLTNKVASLKQNSDSIEIFYGKLLTLWNKIDRRLPNPMKCASDTTISNAFIQHQCLYQFLAGLNDSLDRDRRDLLNQDPLPTVDKAFATIRQNITRRAIMKGNSSSGNIPSEIGHGLISRGRI